MKTKKRLLSILLSLALVLGLMPGMSLTAYADGNVAKVGETEYATLSDALNNWTIGTTLTLLDDVTITSCINVVNNKTLDLNGHTITLNRTGGDQRVINVEAKNVTFDLRDSSGTNAGKLTGVNAASDPWSGALYVGLGATVNMYGGTITGNNASWGAGVWVDARNHPSSGRNGGTFNMYGGVITGNSGTYGAGVGVHYQWSNNCSEGIGHFNMYGGTIVGNTSTDGNDVNIKNGIMTMTGGTIGKFSNDNYVAVTFDANNGTGTMSKQYVKKNTATIIKANVNYDTNGAKSDPALSREGYTFAGWNTQANGSGTNYTAGTDSINVSADTTLYAQWTAIPATAPTINSTTGATLSYGYTEGSLSVTATAATDTTYNDLTYQWYSNTTNSTEGGTAITENGTSATYTIPIGKTAGTTEYYYCVVTATRSDNGQTATATSSVATVTVNTKAMTVSAEDVNATVDGQPHGITVNVTDPATGYTVKYGTTEGSYTLDASPTQTEVGEKTVYYQVTADNYTTYTGSAKVTVSAKSAQTITAADVTATYGDTDKSVSATVTDPATVGGDISYAVKEGSGDYIDVDATTGALSIKAVPPTDGKAYVIVTAAETSTYAQATKEVTVTINKANAVAATVTANNRTYDGTAQPLVTVTGEPTGGTMQYALGTETEATEQYTTSIPSKTDAGTYYVWYKVVGDEYHLDVDANVVIVSIDKAPWINKMVFDSAPAGQEGSVNLSDYIAPGGHMGIAKLESGSQSGSYPSVDGTTLKFKFDDLVQGNETIADITIPVTGSANYTDYYITATVSAPAKKHQTLTFDSDKVSKKYGDEKFAVVPTQGAIEGYGDPYGTVSYTSDNVDVAEVSESGEVTIKKIGYAVITAKAERTAYESEARPGYLPATASYILTVIKGDPVVTAPGTKILNYNGQAQELVTAGAAKGGTMQYALGTDATTEPAAELYTTSIPTAADAGTYYVWYKVVGDENYNDSKADCVVAKIGAVISKTVTFKVVNGAWNDETTEEKTVTLIGYEGDALKLTANQIPAVGNKPNDTYKAGSWDVTPDTETAITADITYTYTYVEKNPISVNVTFKVVNGSWNEGEGDEATKDKTVTLTGYEGDTLKLAANQIPAVGNKPNDTYKAGSWDVAPSTDAGITKAMTYTYIYVAKEAAVVTKAPEAKILTYNGQSQELVNAGEVTGGTMLYAFGTDATTEPAAELYKTSIPAGTDAGTYCVWYKVVGDENHTDVATDKVNVTIAKKNLIVTADAKTIIYGDDDAELTYKVTGLVEGDAQDKVVTGTITREAGTEAGTYRITQGTLASENYDITFTEADYTIKKAVQAAPEEQFTSTKSTNAENEDGKISGFDKEKAYQYSSDDGKTWTDVTGKTDVDVKAGTYLIRYAEDKNHESGQTVTITVEAEQQVVPEPEEQAVIINLKSVTQKKNKIQISWTKVKEADGYDVYVDYCGTKSKKAVKTIKKNSITKTSINKINGKKINQKKCFHAYVVAYKMVDGKKVKLAKTVAAHVAGAKRKGYTNPKTLKLTKSSFSIKVGKTAKIKAKVTLADSKKKHISKGHGAKLRYKSSDKKIASIDKNGKIKGIKKGTCTIYVYTINGIMKKAKVTVK